MGFRNRLVQSRTYAPTGNRDLEKISIAFLIQSVDLLHYAYGVGTGIKLEHDEPTFPKQIDRLNSFGISIALVIHSLDPTELCDKETEF